MKTTSFERFAGMCAIVAGVVGLLYSVSFVVLHSALLSALFLALGGLLSVVALIALFHRLGETDSGFALLGMILGSVGTLGAAIHGGYDLANALNAPGSLPESVGNLPSQIDPRGMLTFFVAGLALLVAAYLMQRTPGFSRGFAGLSYLLAVLLIIVYLGRLIVLSASSPLILIPAAITGFIVNPVWYIWLGMLLGSDRQGVAAPSMGRAKM